MPCVNIFFSLFLPLYFYLFNYLNQVLCFMLFYDKYLQFLLKGIYFDKLETKITLK